MTTDLNSHREKLLACTKCEIRATCKAPVFGRGQAPAPYFFVGEAPGRDEDSEGQPFVGQSGKLLDEFLIEAKIENYWISNVIACRPPQNREPLLSEIENCSAHLLRQVHAVKPKVIVTLGATAGSFFTNPYRPTAISTLRGKLRHVFGYWVVSTYHPAYYLRNRTPEIRRMILQDMGLAKQTVTQAS